MKASMSRGAGLALLLALAAALSLSVGVRATRADPASPRAEKQSAEATLAGLTGDRKTASQLAAAVAAVETSLTPAWWTGDDTLDPKLGARVFAAETEAVTALEKIKQPPAGVATAVALLVDADRGLAARALALAAGADPARLAKAQAKFDAAAAASTATAAMEGYLAAWKAAVGLAPAGPQVFTLHSCAFADFAAALGQANATTAVDSIVLKAGCTYLVTGPPEDPGFEPMVTNPLTIVGNGATLARDPAGLPGGLLMVGAWAATGGFTVDGVTFRDGVQSQGAAILVQARFDLGLNAPDVTIRDSVFVDNSQAQSSSFDPGYVGGALMIQRLQSATSGGTVSLVDDVFSGNSTYGGPGGSDPNSWEMRAGGAVFVGGVGSVDITRCTFTGNHTGDAPGGGNGMTSTGGAVFSQGATTVTDSTFTGNSAGTGGSGGAIYVQAPWASQPTSASLTLARNTFANNSSGANGGAVALGTGPGGGTFADTGSTYTDNTASQGGGAVYLAHVTASLTDVEFARNVAGTLADQRPGGALFAASSAAVTISGGSFTGNRAGNGRAIAAWWGGSLTVQGTLLDENAGYGCGRSCFAAISIDGASASIADAVVSRTGGHGVESNASLVVTGTTFSENVGSGIVNRGTLTVRDSTFSENDVRDNMAGSGAGPGFGGGIMSWAGTVTVARSTFAGNLARIGGGIANVGGTLVVVNSTLSGNVAEEGGGAIENGAAAVITNATLSGNVGGSGAGVRNFGTLTLWNTIVADSNGPACGGAVAGGSNLVWPDDGTCTGFSAGDPLLAPLADNGGPTETMALGPGSAALDAADDGVCLAAAGPPDYGAGGVDQRGVTRPQGAHCDVGAVEGGT